MSFLDFVGELAWQEKGASKKKTASQAASSLWAEAKARSDPAIPAGAELAPPPPAPKVQSDPAVPSGAEVWSPRAPQQSSQPVISHQTAPPQPPPQPPPTTSSPIWDVAPTTTATFTSPPQPSAPPPLPPGALSQALRGVNAQLRAVANTRAAGQIEQARRNVPPAGYPASVASLLSPYLDSIAGRNFAAAHEQARRTGQAPQLHPSIALRVARPVLDTPVYSPEGFIPGVAPLTYGELQTLPLGPNMPSAVTERDIASDMVQRALEDAAQFGRSTPPPTHPASTTEVIRAPQRMGMPTVVERNRPSSLSQLGKTFDRYIGKPLDFMAQVGASATPLLMRAGSTALGVPGAPDLYRAAEEAFEHFGGPNLPNLPSDVESARNILRDVADPAGAVERFRERPLSEQLAAGLVYDPTNLAGIGLLGKASKADDAVRLARQAASGADDTVRTAVSAAPPSGAPSLSSRARSTFDSVNRVLADETGGGPLPLRSEVADVLKRDAPLRVTGAGLGAGIGYTSSEGESWQDRLTSTLMGAGIGAALPEITNIGSIANPLPGTVAGAVGKDIHTFGRNLPKQAMNLPESERYGGINTFIPLLDTSGVRAGPQQKIKLTARVARGNQDSIIRLSENLTDQILASWKSAGVEIDDAGRVIGKDGSYLPAFVENNPARGALLSGGVPLPAGFADAIETLRKAPHIYDHLLAPAQRDALRRSSSVFEDLRQLERRAGVEYEDVEGYFPRGRPRTGGELLEEQEFRRRLNLPVGVEPGAYKERGFRTQAQAFAEGLHYDPRTAINRRIQDALTNVNVAHYADEIKKVEVDKFGPLGAADARPFRQELEELRSQARQPRRDRVKLQAKVRKLGREAYLNDRTLQSNKRQIEKLLQRYTGQEDVPLEDALPLMRDSLLMAKRTITGALDQAKQAMKETVEQARTQGRARGNLDQLQKKAADWSRKVNEMLAEVDEQVARIERFTEAGESTRAGLREIGESLADPAARTPELREEFLSLQQALKWSQESIEAAEQLRDAAIRRVANSPELRRLGWTEAERIKEAAARLGVAEAKPKYAAAVRRAEQLVRQMAGEARATGRADILTRQAQRQAAKSDKLKQQLDELYAAIDEVDDILKPLHVRNAEIRRDIDRAVEIAKARKAEWGGEANWVAPLGNIPMPAKWADEVNRLFAEIAQAKTPAEKLDKYMGAMSRIWRHLGANLDGAHALTIGIAQAADSPAAAIRSFKEGWRGMLTDGGSFMEFLADMNKYAEAKDLPPVNRILAGVDISPPETAIGRSIREGKGLTKAEQVVEEHWAFRPFRKSAQFFDSGTAAMRIRHAYTLLDEMRRSGRDPHSWQAIFEATTAARQIGGRSLKRFGEDFTGGRFEPIVELAWFAGRYLRSQFEVLGNAMLSGELEGRIARRALLRLGALATSAAYLTAEATGAEWDPSKPFQVRNVFGYNLDFAGGWGTMYNMFQRPVEELQKGEGVGTALMHGPVAFFRGKLGPVPQTAFNVAGVDWPTGYEIPSLPTAIAEGMWDEVINKLAPLPFNARDIMEYATDIFREGEESDPIAWARVAFGTLMNFVGQKNHPVSPYQKFGAELDEAYEEYVPTYYEKPDDVRQDPLFIKEYVRDNPTAEPNPTTDNGRALREIEDTFKATFEDLDQRFLSGKINLDRFKDEWSSASALMRGQMEHIVNEFRQDYEPGTPKEWVVTYFDLFDKATIEGTETVDFEVFGQLENEWVKKYGEEALQYVRDLQLADTTPARKAYKEAIFRLDDAGYFDMPRYQNIESDLGEVRQILAHLGSTSLPEGIKGQSIEVRAAYWILQELGREDNKETRQLFFDVVNAYKADQALTYIRTQKRKPKPGTISHEGLKYLNLEYLEIALKHAEDIKWLDDNNYIYDLTVPLVE